jgi:CheY-like chemotaxis protein
VDDDQNLGLLVLSRPLICSKQGPFEALEILGNPKLMFDIKMPYLDGIDVLNKLRQEHKDVCVVITTAAREDGRTGKIPKLLSQETLISSKLTGCLSVLS